MPAIARHDDRLLTEVAALRVRDGLCGAVHVHHQARFVDVHAENRRTCLDAQHFVRLAVSHRSAGLKERFAESARHVRGDEEVIAGQSQGLVAADTERGRLERGARVLPFGQIG